MHIASVSVSEGALVATAAFTALAAFAALASVLRVERDRWRQTIPAMHLEVLADVPNNEMRMTIVNLAAPAREVRVMGTIGDFGWVSVTPPTSYWRPGETRTYHPIGGLQGFVAKLQALTTRITNIEALQRQVVTMGPGVITQWGGATPAAGALLCDGSTIPTMATLYPQLFAVLGTTTLPNVAGTPIRVIWTGIKTLAVTVT